MCLLAGMFTGRGSGEWRRCRGKGSLAGVHSDAITIIRRGGGLATAADLLTAFQAIGNAITRVRILN